MNTGGIHHLPIHRNKQYARWLSSSRKNVLAPPEVDDVDVVQDDVIGDPGGESGHGHCSITLFAKWLFLLQMTRVMSPNLRDPADFARSRDLMAISVANLSKSSTVNS